MMYTGNYADVKGGVAIIDLNTFEVEETIDFGVGVAGFDIDSNGMIYVAMSDYDASWNATCGIMKYDSEINAVINDAQNLIFEAPYVVMGFYIDSNDRLYLPLYTTDNINYEDPDSLKVFENEQIVKTIETGNGPQMMVEVEI
ncbi:MAG: hypothetical protein GQ534_06830 [Candidatus Delongbacteria bacterium]|nr:hypothetical protein [Candidatus Delongbacteria bacterium]